MNRIPDRIAAAASVEFNRHFDACGLEIVDPRKAMVPSILRDQGRLTS